jgi:cadmium resistance protein CadD (predicted permease)
MQHHITSIFAFISTNIDDIFILMLFFGSKRFAPSTIILGQYLGIASLVVISLIGSYVSNFVDQRYVGLLGLFPIYLAVMSFIELIKHGGSKDDVDIGSRSARIISVAGVTFANGADNLGVYIPLMSTMSYVEKIEMLIVFAVMTYLWCILGKFLASRPLVARQIDRYGHVIMPAVLFLLGVFILIESKSHTLL